jgi:hypothetical protein
MKYETESTMIIKPNIIIEAPIMNDQGLLNIFGNCNIRSIRKDKKINVVIKLKKDNPTKLLSTGEKY